MTRQEIIAEHLATLRASVAGGEENHADIAFKRVVYAALATPGCEAQGVRLVDLPHLAERVAEMADAHEALRAEHAAWGAIIDATRADRDRAREQVAGYRDIHGRIRDALGGDADIAVENLARAVVADRDAARAEVAALRAQVAEAHRAGRVEMRGEMQAWADDALGVMMSAAQMNERAAADAARRAERDRCAAIVSGWHISKGGYTELAHVLRQDPK